MAKDIINPKYPIYIISKGRWESRYTSKSLEEIKCPYRIVIEPQEFEQYAKVIDPSKILVLPFSNLGQGSIPARNWVWEHSISEGHEKHWILDDNIDKFFRVYNNQRVMCGDGYIFRQCEDFIDRFENVKMGGMNYRAFVIPHETKRMPPYYLNTRVYSCILLSNDIDFRWRGRYNEDTDLSLRILKAGYPTILINAFFCGKKETLSMKGGNTEEVYEVGKETFDNRMKFVLSLQEQHPDIVKKIWRFDRWHHYVDYKCFTNIKPILKKGLEFKKELNERGMILVRLKNEIN